MKFQYYYYFIYAYAPLFCYVPWRLRSMFVDKFLLWKVFPISCLKWILQFAVHECPPGTSLLGHNRPELLNTVQHLLAVWSKKEFVQTAPIEQQACILFNCTNILSEKHVE